MLRRQNEKLLALISRQTNRLLKKLKKQHEKKEVTNMEVELCGLEYQMLGDKNDDLTVAKREMFHSYLAKLGDSQEMRVITMRFVDGMTFQEIASEERLSKNRIYKIYRRSIQKIRDRIT